ncbi:MAG TPA: hypothetical protein VGG26_10375 [Terracidiphilus sp.]|jgi:hypothetical protein
MRKTLQRVGLWVLIGATITCFWVLVMMLIGPRHNISHWPIIAITIPASMFGRSRPVTYYEVMLLNAVIYGLTGLALEPLLRLRRQLPAKPR